MDDFVYDQTIDASEPTRGRGRRRRSGRPAGVARGARAGGTPRPLTVLTSSRDRVAPICRWFGDCGGCAAQHMSPRLYSEWKRGNRSSRALARAGRRGRSRRRWSTRMAPGGGARRFTRASIRTGKRTSASCAPARTKSSASTNARCSAPKWRGAIAAARALAGELRGLDKPLDIQATATLEWARFRPARHPGRSKRLERRKLARAAEALDLARVSNHGEILIERRAPGRRFRRGSRDLPPGGFLQATMAGEEMLGERGRRRRCSGARRVADLFCGAGRVRAAARRARTKSSPSIPTPPRSRR